MKNLIGFVIFFLGLSVLISCVNSNSDSLSKTFSGVVFNIAQPADSTGVVLDDSIHDATNAYITVTKSSGEVVYSRKKVGLVFTSDGLKTAPIDLLPDKYIISELFLTKDSSTVLYASPRRGSILSKVTKFPVDVNFSVVIFKYATVRVSIVEVGTRAPEDFGYRLFSLNPLNFFSVGVRTTVNGKQSYGSFQAALLKGKDTLAAYSFGTGIFVMRFNCENDDELTLVLTKDGFARYTKVFKFPDLVAELNKKALVIDLKAALTLRLIYQHIDSNDNNIQFDLDTDGEIPLIVDWGDGNIETIKSTSYNDGTTRANAYFDHSYATDSINYFVSITGSLEKVIGYNGDHNEFVLEPISVSALSSLKVVDMSVSGTSALLDLRQNTKLEQLYLGADSVLLPKKNALHEVRIFSEIATSLDYIIGNVYSNAFTWNISNGKFNFSAGVTDNDSNEMIATPSDVSLTKLKKLRDNFHWAVYPNP